MRRVAFWVWRHGVVSTFMTGFFVLLPIAITLAIMGWAGSKVVQLLGPESLVGRALGSLGLQLLGGETRQWIGTLIGYTMVLVTIWLVGVLVKTLTKKRVQQGFHNAIDHIPFVSSIYRPIAQVVSMLQQGESEELRAMSVVYCTFGEENGGGFLALLASPEKFTFAHNECYALYIPTSPVPMSGGIVFVPCEKVMDVDMQVDDLMQIYFSLGVMAPRVVPNNYRNAS